MTGDEKQDMATVVAAHGRRGQIEASDGRRYPYVVKGRNLRIVCGDRVRWEANAAGEGAVITAIAERNNQLSRAPSDARSPEILAANISLLAIVVAPQPEVDWLIVDRYLCAAEEMDCAAILIANKLDLEHEKLLKKAGEYSAIGYSCLGISTQSGRGLDELTTSLVPHTTILVGQSGVGKSSIINSLVADADVAVGGLSQASAEGKHTTTASLMYELPGGGRLIDTPGVRDFIPALEDARAVAMGFREIRRASEKCRFHNCQHLREPNCAVKSNVKTGAILPHRYASYKRLLHNVLARLEG